MSKSVNKAINQALSQPTSDAPAQPEKLKTRDRILEAAREIFTEQGVKGATTREIAKAAEVNETTLFRHFQNKDALFKAVVEQAAAEISEAITGKGMSNNDLRKDLGVYAEKYTALLIRNRRMVLMLIGEISRQPEEARRVIHNVWQPVLVRLATYLDEAKAQGRVRADVDSMRSVEILRGMLFSNVLKQSVCQDEMLPTGNIDLILDIFIRGIETHNPEGV